MAVVGLKWVMLAVVVVVVVVVVGAGGDAAGVVAEARLAPLPPDMARHRFVFVGGSHHR